ncbi:enterochelin esterase [Winslowiella arboricola]|nr:enterochelin esterase [Winslowiella arboricola]
MIKRTNLMPALQPAGTVAQLLAASNVGQPEWWQQLAEIGTPLVEQQTGSDVRMSYFWRDSGGSQPQTVQVYIDVNGVTDHHSQQPETMQHLAGTDVWYWSAAIDPRWRGSYSLIPVNASQLPPDFSQDADTARQQQRAWWISLFPLAIADPLNPLRPHFTSRRKALSAAHMPDAPVQQGWRTFDSGGDIDADAARLHRFHWQSRLLGNQRPIWLYTSGESAQPEQRPLIIVLDGQNWAQNIPIYAAIDQQTAAGQLPAACWLFIDVIDMAHRGQELPCNPHFWKAVQQELLPLSRRLTPFSDDAQRTVVSGQSYGGLAALYAGLHWPQRFGRILSQSGSFWWPDVNIMHHPETDNTGWLTKQVARRQQSAATLKIFMESGSTEEDIGFVNQQMLSALTAASLQVAYREYIGGHDPLCWRGGLIDGVQALLKDTL